MPISIEKAWNFFSDPANLQKITPNDMGFKTTSAKPPRDEMYPGMIITYTVAPLVGVKLNWTTEITQVLKHSYFIDEQRGGPFAFFHHQHHFQEIEGGVEMTDLLSYAAPLGFLGQIANVLIVSNKLDHIFSYRNKRIEELFGTL